MTPGEFNPVNSNDLTEEAVLAGCMELFAYNRDYDDPRETIKRIYVAVVSNGRSFEQGQFETAAIFHHPV